MKTSVYPWAEMNPGDVRFVESRIRLKNVRQAGIDYAKRQERKGKPRPAFEVTDTGQRTGNGKIVITFVYRIERTA